MIYPKNPGVIATYENYTFMNKVKVILIDDSAAIRHGLRQMLSRSSQVKVIGEAGDGEKALYLVESLDPDVMLLDVEMPGMKGYEVAQRLAEIGSKVRVLALSGYHELHHILGMFTNGAVGYLTKDEAPKLLVNAVQEIAAGAKGWISPKIAKKLGVPARPLGKDTIPTLTKLEKTVLKRIFDGKTKSEIMQELGISSADIDKNFLSLFKKLKVKSRSEAILRAIQEELI